MEGCTSIVNGRQSIEELYSYIESVTGYIVASYFTL